MVSPLFFLALIVATLIILDCIAVMGEFYSFLEAHFEVFKSHLGFFKAHLESWRDLEKSGDLRDLLFVYGLKLLCTIGFVVLLFTISWFSSPIERFVRQDVQAERDRALVKARELEAESSERKEELDRAVRDRDVVRGWFSKVAGDNTVLGNKLSQYEALPEKCQKMEETIDELEQKLAMSKQCRRYEEKDRAALASKAENAQEEIDEAKAIAGLQVLSIKAKYEDDLKAAIQKERDAARRALPIRTRQLQSHLKEALANQCSHRDLYELRDHQAKVIDQLRADLTAAKAAKAASEAQVAGQSSQTEDLKAEVESGGCKLKELTEDLSRAQRQSDADCQKLGELQSQVEGLALQLADQAEKALRIEELEKLAGQKEAELAALRETMSNDLAAKEAVVAAKDAELEKSNGELAAKNADIERIEAQHREVCQSQQTKIDHLQNDLADRDNAMDTAEEVPEQRPSLEEPMDVDAAAAAPATPTHDHSICVEKFAEYEQRIGQLDQARLDRDAAVVSTLRKEATALAFRNEGLKAQIADKNQRLDEQQVLIATGASQLGHLRESLDLGDDADFETVERQLRAWKSGPDSGNAGSHSCDHSVCERQALAASQEAAELRQAKEVAERELAQLHASRVRWVARVRGENKVAADKLAASEKALAEEKAGRQKAVEKEREEGKQRLRLENPLVEEVKRLRRDLAKALAERDASRDANFMCRAQSIDARGETREVSQLLQHTESQRDKLVTEHSSLVGQIAQAQVDSLRQADPAEASDRSRRQREEEEAAAAAAGSGSSSEEDGDAELEVPVRPIKRAKGVKGRIVGG